VVISPSETWTGVNASLRNGLTGILYKLAHHSSTQPYSHSYQEFGLAFGIVTTGIFYRRASTRFSPWGFYKTIATAGAAGFGGYTAGEYLRDYRMTQFNTDNDNYILARIAQVRARVAFEKDKVEAAMEGKLSSVPRPAPVGLYRQVLDELDKFEQQFAEQLVVGEYLSSLSRRGMEAD
jgi:hypothetical protein